ncbi:MAG: homogentisate 1,2-dioxygenase, partial [Lentisphaeria bacterium]|nr:homogentisate 1,2-dioxygenase [Lentisphaeria bacterium]NQZ69461.1 homogentisate 1,2-dioxygenase [Lentisphaeria bacterium]
SGQAHLSAPIVESNIDVPDFTEPMDETGDYKIYCQSNNGQVSEISLGHHPFDLLGWEGALYPFRFDIKNHHGIAKSTHSSPPMHQTFQTGNVPCNGFSLCSFVPQPAGWHPKNVPAPYAHFNVDSDEIMFFCNANYGARKGIVREGSITFHPGALPHSPHGKAAENSLKSRGQMMDRLAVMLDTYFEEMQISEYAWQLADQGYSESWGDH